jgi:membrane-associated protein
VIVTARTWLVETCTAPERDGFRGPAVRYLAGSADQDRRTDVMEVPMTAVLTPMLLALGPLAVLLLMAVVFAETGLLVGSFLPGDSLLFTAGVMLAAHAIAVPVWLVVAGVAASAVAGDLVGYLLGRRFGPRVLSRPGSRWFSPHHAERAEAFFARHGAKAIVLARFVPLVRTLTPVVAGVGQMPRRRFTTFNVVGGVAWTAAMIGAGVWFGHIPLVADHIELAAVALVALSLVPAALGWAQSRRRLAAPPSEPVEPVEPWAKKPLPIGPPLADPLP